jgi:hypothetical protein
MFEGGVRMNTESISTAADIRQLNQAVAGLTEALALSERRYAHLGRMVRWGTVALAGVLLLAGFLIADRTGIAHAQSDAGFPQATSAVEALNNINANLMVLGELGKTMQQFSPAVREAIMGNPDVQKHVQQYFEEKNLNPSPDQQEAYAMQAIVGGVVGTFVDAFVLMQRIRDDSNAFRDYITGPEDVLRGVEHQLEVMNLAMASIPAMAAQMDLMNRNMASMSYSMGSTMGRMGKWVPW